MEDGMQVPWKYVSKKNSSKRSCFKKMTQFSHYIISGYGINKLLKNICACGCCVSSACALLKLNLSACTIMIYLVPRSWNLVLFYALRPKVV
jgi:hypothetical protein